MNKLAKPSIENLRILGEVLYNLTGLEYYLSLTLNYYTSVASFGAYRGQFFEFYYMEYNQLKTIINAGGTFKYPLYNLGTKQPKPFIYNSLF